MRNLVAVSFRDLLDTAPGEHADRISRADSNCDSNLTRFWSDQGIIEFSSRCGENYSTGPWTQLVQLQNWWQAVVETNPDVEELVLNAPGGSVPWDQLRPYLNDELQNGDVLIYCDCPDFLYSGAMYNVTTDHAVYPGFEQGVAPKKHWEWGLGNARICKHLYKVYDRFLRV